MSSDDLIQEISKVFTALKLLETEGTVAEAGEVPAAVPVISLKKAFKNDQVTCMICGKSGFKTLTRHLGKAHDLKPGQYRKQFNIPSSQPLTAKNYSESRRQAANENNLAANLVKARAVRAAKNSPPVVIKQVVEPAIPVVAAKAVKPVKAARKPVKAKALKE
jgi:predicted transcriptional regulator